MYSSNKINIHVHSPWSEMFQSSKSNSQSGIQNKMNSIPSEFMVSKRKGNEKPRLTKNINVKYSYRHLVALAT